MQPAQKSIDGSQCNLDSIKKSDFPICLILSVLVEVCTFWVLLLLVLIYCSILSPYKPVVNEIKNISFTVFLFHCNNFYMLILAQVKVKQTRLGQLGANISPDRSSLTPQVLIGNF